MQAELIRVESAVSATAGGDLSWERWSHDYAVALGFAGQRNPLGFAVVRYLSAESAISAQALVLTLASELIKRGCCLSQDANRFAWQAFEFWQDMRCPACDGRGAAGHDHRMCPACSGTGQRKYTDRPSVVRDAVSAMIEAEQWMENQLRVRLKKEAA